PGSDPSTGQPGKGAQRPHSPWRALVPGNKRHYVPCMIWRWLRRGGRAAPLDEALWRRLRRRSRLLRALDSDAAALLRERAGAFLADKAITGAAGFEASPGRKSVG